MPHPSSPTDTRRALLLGVATALATPAVARAQPVGAWPDRPVRFVVPFAAGGAIDTLSRAVASRFPEHANGQPLVVENRPGAGGMVGAASIVGAPPDGYESMQNRGGWSSLGYVAGPQTGEDGPKAVRWVGLAMELPQPGVAMETSSPHDFASSPRPRQGGATGRCRGPGCPSKAGFERRF